MELMTPVVMLVVSHGILGVMFPIQKPIFEQHIGYKPPSGMGNYMVYRTRTNDHICNE